MTRMRTLPATHLWNDWNPCRQSANIGAARVGPPLLHRIAGAEGGVGGGRRLRIAVVDQRRHPGRHATPLRQHAYNANRA